MENKNYTFILMEEFDVWEEGYCRPESYTITDKREEVREYILAHPEHIYHVLVNKEDMQIYVTFYTSSDDAPENDAITYEELFD